MYGAREQIRSEGSFNGSRASVRIKAKASPERAESHAAYDKDGNDENGGIQSPFFHDGRACLR
jgi:hypothetical protein